MDIELLTTTSNTTLPVYGVNYARRVVGTFSSWDISNDFLYKYFKQYGLIDSTRPRLSFAHPGMVEPTHSPYLFTVWETTKLPEAWLPSLNQYERIFVPSRWNYRVFQEAGCKNLSYVPLGFEPDIFHPEGERFDFQCEKPFLNICHNQYRKGLDVTIRAWQAVKDHMPDAHLFLFGSDIKHEQYLGTSAVVQQHGKLKHYEYISSRITFLEPSEPLTYEELATLYRGAHTFVLNSRSEGFGFPILEAMGCGTLTIVPNYGATAEFISGRNCLALMGVPVIANYTDRGFEDVGFWWEPSLEHLKELLIEAYQMSDTSRSEITQRAQQFVLAKFTWQQVALNMQKALEEFQIPQERVVMTPETDRLSVEVWCAQKLVALGRQLISIGELVATYGAWATVKRVIRAIQRRLFHSS